MKDDQVRLILFVINSIICFVIVSHRLELLSQDAKFICEVSVNRAIDV